MSPADRIEPSLADAPAILPVARKGRLVYIVHGICEVASLAEALDLIQDRRQAPRSIPVAIAQPVVTIVVGIGADASCSYTKSCTYI